MRTMMSGKIHRATVTEANLDYEGSITLDPDLMEAAGILPYEQVAVVDVTNGARLETYAIKGERGSGEVCINGAAAHLCHRGDTVIIIAYQQVSDEEARRMEPRKVFVDTQNRIKRIEVGDGFAHHPRPAATPRELSLAGSH
ncbi:MAG: aspartate 1-decarboxylase [Dehalococcoidia bacterium]